MNLERVYAPETVRIYLDRWAEKGNEKLYESVLFRLDSGNDAFDNLKMLLKSPYYFVIKKNRRTEKREDWLRIAQERGFAEEQRAGKTVYTGVLRGQHPKASEKDALPDIDQIFRITERTIEWIMKFYIRNGGRGPLK